MTITHFKDKTVLVVDDAAFIRSMVIRSLQERNISKVKEAVDGRQALAALHTHQYDLVISDLHMPEVDGFELLLEMKMDEHLSKIPFLLLTSDVSVETVKKAIENGISDFLAKPFRSEQLLEKVDKLLVSKK